MAKLTHIKLERWMTPRDRDIIVSVYRHGILNSKQVESLHFRNQNNSRIIALRRLKKLVDNKFLKLHWYGYHSQGSMQHFTITNKGAMIVASQLGLEPSAIKVKEAGIISNIEHTSLIVDFHISILNNGFTVKGYSVDYLNRKEFNHGGRNIIFEPDGKGIMHKSRELPFFLEMDRGTMSYNYFKGKIPNYESYYSSRKYLDDFESFPLVFIISTSNERVSKMKKLIEKERKSDITYLLTTIDKMSDLSKMVLRKAGDDKLYSLK